MARRVLIGLVSRESLGLCWVGGGSAYIYVHGAATLYRQLCIDREKGKRNKEKRRTTRAFGKSFRVRVFTVI